MRFKLSTGQWATIDDADAHILGPYRWRLWGNYVGRAHRRRKKGIFWAILLHREIMGLRRGDPRQVDHIDGNPLNNSRSNLRVVSQSKNKQNLRRLYRNNTSGYRGVSHDRGRWRARITINGKQHLIGFFRTPEAAHKAAEKARRDANFATGAWHNMRGHDNG